MSPQSERIDLPRGYTLGPRHICPSTTDERMVVRDEKGRVVALIEALRPDLLPN